MAKEANGKSVYGKEEFMEMTPEDYNFATIGFKLKAPFGKTKCESTFVFCNDAEDLYEMGCYFNMFLEQCGYPRKQRYMLMEDVTETEMYALSAYLHKTLRKGKD